jgi:hypothetical protein
VGEMKVKNLFKSTFSGLVGSGVFLMLAIFLFAIAKIVFIIFKRDLLISKFYIMLILAIFVILGFIYGVSCFVRKNSYRKLLNLNWKNFLLNIIIAILFTLIGNWIIRSNFGMKLSPRGYILLFVVLFILNYLFSSILVAYLAVKKKRPKQHNARNIVWIVLFNPIFIMIYVWLFLFVAYNSIYIPCGVTITGIDKNVNTANTLNLDISHGEKVVSIDGTQIASLQDVRRYLDSLTSTKEVALETTNKIYLLKTYKIDGKRFMGLLLQQDYCERKY